MPKYPPKFTRPSESIASCTRFVQRHDRESARGDDRRAARRRNGETERRTALTAVIRGVEDSLGRVRRDTFELDVNRNGLLAGKGLSESVVVARGDVDFVGFTVDRDRGNAVQLAAADVDRAVFTQRNSVGERSSVVSGISHMFTSYSLRMILGFLILL